MTSKHPIHHAVPVLLGPHLVGYLRQTFTGWAAYSANGTCWGVYPEDDQGRAVAMLRWRAQTGRLRDQQEAA